MIAGGARPAPERAAAGRKVLVVAPAWVGDMVLAGALAPGLRAGGAEVHFLAPAITAPVAERLPGVSATHRHDARRGRLDWARRRAAARRLAPLACQQAIVLPGSWKAALAPLMAKIPQRTGFRGEARYGLINDMRRLRPGALPRLVDRFAALADTTPAPPRLRVDAANRGALLARLGLRRDRPVVALCPGAEYGSAKRWPPERFGMLARLCADAGAAVWVLGGPRDRGAAEVIARHAPVTDVVGKTSLTDAIDLLSAANAAVANDSGLMHVAAALNLPVVALFGATSPRFTPPLAAAAAVVERSLPCRPCGRRECPLGHHECLRGIAPARVFSELERLGAFASRRRRDGGG